MGGLLLDDAMDIPETQKISWAMG